MLQFVVRPWALFALVCLMQVWCYMFVMVLLGSEMWSLFWWLGLVLVVDITWTQFGISLFYLILLCCPLLFWTDLYQLCCIFAPLLYAELLFGLYLFLISPAMLLSWTVFWVGSWFCYACWTVILFSDLHNLFLLLLHCLVWAWTAMPKLNCFNLFSLSQSTA